MDGLALTAAISPSMMPRPVRSAMCRMRATLWPPSLTRWKSGLSPLRSNGRASRSTSSSWTTWGPRRARYFTARGELCRQPQVSMSRSSNWGESSFPRNTIPPWARALLPSSRSSPEVSRITSRPSSAKVKAVVRPAMPDPTTSASVCMRYIMDLSPSRGVLAAGAARSRRHGA